MQSLYRNPCKSLSLLRIYGPFLLSFVMPILFVLFVIQGQDTSVALCIKVCSMSYLILYHRSKLNGEKCPQDCRLYA